MIVIGGKRRRKDVLLKSDSPIAFVLVTEAVLYQDLSRLASAASIVVGIMFFFSK